jgi:hypothetical protein
MSWNNGQKDRHMRYQLGEVEDRDRGMSMAWKGLYKDQKNDQF